MEQQLKQEKKLWFRAKRYGYGWTPYTWQGWLAIFVYVVVLFCGVVFAKSSSAIYLLVPVVFFATAALITLCLWKGERPSWHWGK